MARLTRNGTTLLALRWLRTTSRPPSNPHVPESLSVKCVRSIVPEKTYVYVPSALNVKPCP